MVLTVGEGIRDLPFKGSQIASSGFGLQGFKQSLDPIF